MKLGVVGLGQMGLPVAAALSSAGHEVLAWDTDRRRPGCGRRPRTRGRETAFRSPPGTVAPPAPPAPPGFTLRLGLKDLELRAAAAQAVRLCMPVADAVQARLAEAVAAGHGGRDWTELPHCLPDSSRPDPT